MSKDAAANKLMKAVMALDTKIDTLTNSTNCEFGEIKVALAAIDVRLEELEKSGKGRGTKKSSTTTRDTPHGQKVYNNRRIYFTQTYAENKDNYLKNVFTKKYKSDKIPSAMAKEMKDKKYASKKGAALLKAEASWIWATYIGNSAKSAIKELQKYVNTAFEDHNATTAAKNSEGQATPEGDSPKSSRKTKRVTKKTPVKKEESEESEGSDDGSDDEKSADDADEKSADDADNIPSEDGSEDGSEGSEDGSADAASEESEEPEPEPVKTPRKRTTKKTTSSSRKTTPSSKSSKPTKSSSTSKKPVRRVKKK